MAAKETVDARKTRYDADALLALIGTLDKIVSIKGKSVRVFELKRERPEDAVLLEALLGPTGNLRAPALRIGGTLVVGFAAEQYRQFL